jgi:hypothetical protein
MTFDFSITFVSKPIIPTILDFCRAALYPLTVSQAFRYTHKQTRPTNHDEREKNQ